MLRIEICTDSNENFDLEPGTYKTNSKMSDSTDICEYISSGVPLLDGYINIFSTSEVERYEYKTHNYIIEHEYYKEEKVPNRKYRGYWQNIIYPEEAKLQLFNDVMKLESTKRSVVDMLGVNKCVLIYGVPGTGKTTLSKAIAQKLSIRMSRMYELRIVKCSQLFSRFYGESMKIVNTVFKNCPENTIILVDEADSMLMKRKNVFMKNEPGDSLRIINTLLNIIDESRNLIIFTTNFKNELDDAFLSRCDVVFHMKTLDHRNTYNLLKLILEDLQSAGELEECAISDYSSVEICGRLADEVSFILFEVSDEIQDMSPRMIKKMIFKLLRNEKEKTVDFLRRFRDNMRCKEVKAIETPQSSTRLFE